MSELEPQKAPQGKLRQRLIGALVVVALAVLLLPLWLDGGGLKTPEVQPIPAVPKIAQPADIIVPAPAPAQMDTLQNPPASALPDNEPGLPSNAAESPQKNPETTVLPPIKALVSPAQKPTQTVKPIDTKPVDLKPQNKPEITAELQKQTPLAPRIEKPIEKTAEKPIEKSEPSQASVPTARNEGEWVVQLGSFSDELNARGLAKSVTDAGFKVEVSPLFAKKGTVWRVRVGPYTTRDQAAKTTIQLRERLGRDGLVMPK